MYNGISSYVNEKKQPETDGLKTQQKHNFTDTNGNIDMELPKFDNLNVKCTNV